MAEVLNAFLSWLSLAVLAAGPPGQPESVEVLQERTEYRGDWVKWSWWAVPDGAEGFGWCQCTAIPCCLTGCGSGHLAVSRECLIPFPPQGSVGDLAWSWWFVPTPKITLSPHLNWSRQLTSQSPMSQIQIWPLINKVIFMTPWMHIRQGTFGLAKDIWVLLWRHGISPQP